MTPEQAILVTLWTVALFGIIVAAIVSIQDWQEAKKRQMPHYKKA